MLDFLVSRCKFDFRGIWWKFDEILTKFIIEFLKFLFLSCSSAHDPMTKTQILRQRHVHGSRAHVGNVGQVFVVIQIQCSRLRRENINFMQKTTQEVATVFCCVVSVRFWSRWRQRKLLSRSSSLTRVEIYICDKFGSNWMWKCTKICDKNFTAIYVISLGESE
jgi:hypothetical protein